MLLLSFGIQDDAGWRPLCAEALERLGLFLDVDLDGEKVAADEVSDAVIGVNLGFQPSATRSHGCGAEIEKSRLFALARLRERGVNISNPIDRHENSIRQPGQQYKRRVVGSRRAPTHVRLGSRTYGNSRIAVYSTVCMKVIANPYAGRGRTSEYIKRLDAAMKARRADCELWLTEGPGHATELAARVVREGGQRLIAVGGDGTVSEVAGAIAGSPTELAVVATGRGNDVARCLGLPQRDLQKSLDIGLNGVARRIDVGRERDRIFVASMGVGLPARVVELTHGIRWLPGTAAYLIGVLRSLAELRPLPFKVWFDGEVAEIVCSAIMVHNIPLTGGGLRLAPQAEFDDGLFDVAIIGAIGKMDLLLNLPGVYRGKHLHHPSFTVRRCRKIRIEPPHRMAKMFDGDVCGESPADAEIVPGSLNVVVPAGHD